ncbi:MAG: tetratricopeptide repeat protein [Bacteroidia bacterium]
MKYTFFYTLLACLSLYACKTTQNSQTTAKKEEKKIEAKPTDSKNAAEDVSGLFIDACTEMIAGDAKVAKELFKQVLKADPKHHASMYNIAKLALEVGADKKDFEEAILMGEEALKYDAENYWYYVTVVDAYKMKGDFENAIRVQTALNQRFSTQKDTYFVLADLYKKTTSYDKAIAIYQQIETKFGYDELIILEKFKLYEDTEKYDDATAMLDKLMKSNPAKTEYYHYKYQLLSKQGKNKEAIEVLKSLLKVQPSDPLALISLADYYKQMDNMQESDKYLFRTFENAETPVKGKLNIVQNLMKEYADKEVADRVRRLIKIIAKIHPNTPEANELQGDIYHLDNQQDSAWSMYKKSLLADPRNDKLWIKLLRESNDTENYMRLLSDAGDALEYYPSNDMIQFYYGISNLRLEYYDAAISSFDKLRKRSSNIEMLMMAEASLAEAKIGAKRTAEAQKGLEDALKKYPQGDILMHVYANFLLGQGNENLVKAQEWITKALTIQPNRTDYLLTQARVFYAQNNFVSANESLEKAINLGNPSAEILQLSGDTLFKMNKKGEATAQWEKAIKAGAKGLNIEKRKKELGG